MKIGFIFLSNTTKQTAATSHTQHFAARRNDGAQQDGSAHAMGEWLASPDKQRKKGGGVRGNYDDNSLELD